MNPYFDSEKLGWKTVSFHEPDLSYEYNTLCFWVTKDGLVYSASDSGCSCPTPFEGYEGNSELEITKQLERVGSYDQALAIFNSWNKDYDNKPFLSKDEFFNEKLLKEVLK